MSEIKYKSKYHKLRKENGFTVVTNNNLELFFLDDISSDIYFIFGNEKNINEVVDIMLNELSYDVEKGILSQDVKELVEGLIEKGLLEVIDGYRF